MLRLSFILLTLLAAVGSPALGFAQTNAKEIMSREAAALVALLGRPDAPVFEKAKACQRLAVIGSADAIPALTALLADEQLNQYARTALEGIPGSEVEAALREALGKLDGGPLVGVINSIGRRGDPQAVPQLEKLLGHSDPAVTAAAARALGKLAGDEAARVLQKALASEQLDRTVVADACLIAADQLAASGKRERALELYDAVAKADVPQYLQVAVLRGKFRLLGNEAQDLLLEQIRSQDEAFFHVGLAAARDLPGPETTEALANELKQLPPDRQALLITVLGERQNPPSLSLLQKMSSSESAGVREAALQVLAKIGGPEAVQTLLDAALSGDAVSQQAGELLKTISSDDADQAILTRLRNAEPKQQAVLIPLVGARRITAATAAVKNLLDDPQEPVRLAAITALGQLVSLNELDLLTRRALQGSSPAESQAAQAALKAAAMRMTDREACSAKLAALVPEASAEQQVYLLELLTQLSGPKALATVAELAQANDPMLKDTATRLLGEWPDATAAPALLAIAKSEKDTKYQVRAMRGYLRIARQLQMPDDERIAMFRTALDVASRKEEKQLAFDILTRIPSAATLDLATSYVRDPALRNAAAGAAIKIAPKVLNADPKGVAAAMQKVLDAGVGGNLAPRAKQLLGQARGAGA